MDRSPKLTKLRPHLHRFMFDTILMRFLGTQCVPYDLFYSKSLIVRFEMYFSIPLALTKIALLPSFNAWA